MFRDTRAANSVGDRTGDRVQFGANVSGGSLGTSLGATYPYAPNATVLSPFPCAPLTVNANFCARSHGVQRESAAAMDTQFRQWY